jgi:hypothetical protein
VVAQPANRDVNQRTRHPCAASGRWAVAEDSVCVACRPRNSHSWRLGIPTGMRRAVPRRRGPAGCSSISETSLDFPRFPGNFRAGGLSRLRPGARKRLHQRIVDRRDSEHLGGVSGGGAARARTRAMQAGLAPFREVPVSRAARRARPGLP